jgi:hypothetical protein
VPRITWTLSAGVPSGGYSETVVIERCPQPPHSSVSPAMPTVKMQTACQLEKTASSEKVYAKTSAPNATCATFLPSQWRYGILPQIVLLTERCSRLRSGESNFTSMSGSPPPCAQLGHQPRQVIRDWNQPRCGRNTPLLVQPMAKRQQLLVNAA